MPITRPNHNVRVIIIVGVMKIGGFIISRGVIIVGEFIFNDAPFRPAHNLVEFTTW